MSLLCSWWISSDLVNLDDSHCFGSLSTSIWQFGMLIHCHMLPACHTNSCLHHHHVPPLFWSRSVVAGHFVVTWQLWRLVELFSTALKPWNGQVISITWPPDHNVCKLSLWNHSLHSTAVLPLLFTQPIHIQGGSNMTGTDLFVNKLHCTAAVRPWDSEVTTSTLPPARVRTCSVLSGSC